MDTTVLISGVQQSDSFIYMCVCTCIYIHTCVFYIIYTHVGTRTCMHIYTWDRRVRPRLVWRNGTPLDSRVVHGVTGHLSICMWNLWVFLDDAPGPLAGSWRWWDFEQFEEGIWIFCCFLSGTEA